MTEVKEVVPRDRFKLKRVGRMENSIDMELVIKAAEKIAQPEPDNSTLTVAAFQSSI